MLDPRDPVSVLRHCIDWVSAITVVGAVAGYLPPIAAVFAIIWYLIQIYESRTVQGWLKREKK
jgi:hypothetical protein